MSLLRFLVQTFSETPYTVYYENLDYPEYSGSVTVEASTGKHNLSALGILESEYVSIYPGMHNFK